MDAVERFATIAEFAREYRVSYEHVRRMCHARELPAERLGKVWRIDRYELPSFIAKCRTSGDAAGGVAGSEDRVQKIA